MAVNLPASRFLIHKMIVMILAFVKHFEICGGKAKYRADTVISKGQRIAGVHRSKIAK